MSYEEAKQGVSATAVAEAIRRRIRNPADDYPEWCEMLIPEPRYERHDEHCPRIMNGTVQIAGIAACHRCRYVSQSHERNERTRRTLADFRITDTVTNTVTIDPF